MCGCYGGCAFDGCDDGSDGDGWEEILLFLGDDVRRDSKRAGRYIYSVSTKDHRTSTKRNIARFIVLSVTSSGSGWLG